MLTFPCKKCKETFNSARDRAQHPCNKKVYKKALKLKDCPKCGAPYGQGYNRHVERCNPDHIVKDVPVKKTYKYKAVRKDLKKLKIKRHDPVHVQMQKDDARKKIL